MVSGQFNYVRKWVEIDFSGDTFCCDLCPLLETYSRRECRRTGELLPKGWLVGRLCPLVDNPGDYIDPYTGELITNKENKNDT